MIATSPAVTTQVEAQQRILGHQIQQHLRGDFSARREAGNLLTKFKEQCQGHTWLAQLERYVGIAERSAQRYMEFYQLCPVSATVADMEQIWSQCCKGGPKAKKASKNGHLLFDDKAIPETYGKLLRLFDERHKAYPTGYGFTDVENAMKDLLAAWTRWQKETT